jgi:hypothetical protein
MREKMELVNLAVEYEIEVSPRMTAEQMRRHIARTLQERGPQVMARETKPITREQLIRLYGKQGGEKMARKLEKALQNREIALKRRITMLRKLAEEEKKG